MDETTITIQMGKQELQQAVTTVIELLTQSPFQFDEHSNKEIAEYNHGMSLLFDCLRSTF